MRWYITTILIVALTMIAARLLQMAGEARDRRRFPPPGRFVGVSGARLHLLMAGHGRGPAIVIEQGAGGVGALWAGIQGSIAEFATVITYDRRGLGWSGAARAGGSVDERVEDLRVLLENAAVPSPCVFVAHSYGGLIARKFARRYPERTAGLVLVDSIEEGIHFQPDVLQLYTGFRKMLALLTVVQYFGLRRLWLAFFPDKAVDADPQRAAVRSLYLRPRQFRAMSEDVLSLARLPAAEREPWPAGTFGDLPLAVITHGKPFPGQFAVLEKYWAAGQERLAALSTSGSLLIAPNSSHLIQDEDPQLVVDTIRRIHVAATLRMAEARLVS